MNKTPTRHLIDDRTGTIRVRRWDDPLVERHGYLVSGEYVEYFWLGTLGPTTAWLMRRLARVVDLHPDGVALDLAELATSLGLGWDSGRANPLVRSFDRLVMFGLAKPLTESLLVRTTVPPLNMKQIERLAPHLRHALDTWSIRGESGTPPLPTISDALSAA